MSKTEPMKDIPNNLTRTWWSNKIDVELPLGKLRIMDELETQNIAVEVK